MRRALIAGTVVLLSMSLAYGQWKDNFDSYTLGGLAGQGGWAIWYSGGLDGQVVNTQAASPPNSLRDTISSDVVQPFSISGGRWQFRIKTYVATGTAGDGFVIMMNTYGSPTTDNWSVQVRFGGTDGLVEAQWVPSPYPTLPLIYDTWVEFRAEIDLVNDLVDFYYNNVPLSLDRIWTSNVSSPPGTLTIACLDLYSQTMDGMYYDDASLMIPGDLNCDGVVNPFDIDPFILALTDPAAYAAAFPACLYLNADANADGIVSPFDIDPFIALLTGP